MICRFENDTRMMYGLQSLPVAFTLPALATTSGVAERCTKSRSAPSTAEDTTPTSTSARSSRTSFLALASAAAGLASVSALTTVTRSPPRSAPKVSSPRAKPFSMWSPSPAYTPENGSSTPTV